MHDMLVSVAMFGWIPVVFILFVFLPPRRAVIAAFIFATLFLPIYSYDIPFFPSYSKMSATSLGVLLGTVVFDPNRFLNFRPRWYDIPVVLFCIIGPFLTSIVNGLGAYDGASWAFSTTVSLGFPYLIGRMYFTDLESLRELAIGIFLGGLVYLPFVVWEWRMSPQLHTWVYGYHQHSWMQTVRDVGLGGFGWRPVVFMNHGLQLALWMSMTALVGVGLWWWGSLRQLYGFQTAFFAVPLVIVAVMCNSVGALFLLMVGLAALFAAVYLRAKWIPLAMLIAMCGYLLVRAPGIWDAAEAIDLADALFSDQRVGSLEYRIDNENLFVERATERPVLGWGRFNRMRPEGGGTVTDSWWIIQWGQRGLVGLVSGVAIFLLPVVLFCRRVPPSAWAHPLVIPSVALAFVLILYMADNMLNSMPNPVYTVVAGGLMGLSGVKKGTGNG
ncbi:MAG: O-antigen ligase domain-containing protein [Candidatus Hydrogenedentota bacterium]